MDDTTGPECGLSYLTEACIQFAACGVALVVEVEASGQELAPFVASVVELCFEARDEAVVFGQVSCVASELGVDGFQAGGEVGVVHGITSIWL